MNKKIIPIIAIIVILIVGGYFLKTKKQTNTVNVPQTVNQTMSEAAEFAKAIESGKPTTCIMTKGSEKMEYFLKGKKMFANITTMIENKTIVSHMINDEKFLYMWSDDQKQGSKISMIIPSPSTSSSSPSEPLTPKFESEKDYENIKNEGYNINCKSSNIDETAFVPPLDIKFIDPTEMMKAIPSPDAAGNIDMSRFEELQKQYGQK